MGKADEARKALEKDQETRNIDYSSFESHMVSAGVRLPESDKRALERHFSERGLKLGQGLRMIIAEYMKRERIR